MPFVLGNESIFVDLNQVVLLHRLGYLPNDSVIDSVTDSVTYPFDSIATPYPPCLSYFLHLSYVYRGFRATFNRQSPHSLIF